MSVKTAVFTTVASFPRRIPVPIDVDFCFPSSRKVHSAFLAHYSKDPKLGESRYADWVAFSGLDETQILYIKSKSV